MIYHNLRTLGVNLLLLLLSSLFGIALLGPFFWTIYSQETFPRALVLNAGTIQSTFYPDTFDRTNPQPYTAVLGDSYGQGMGDAYLTNQDDYSAAHYLHADDNRNYLIFARSGYGSINAAKELLRTISWSDQSPFVPTLDKPERILFFFYEGNDLNNNLEHLEKLGLMGSDRTQLRLSIAKEITDGEELPKTRRVEAWVPFYTLFSNIVQVADKLVYQPYIRTKEANAKPFPVTAGLPEQMRFIAQHDALQSAAAELDEADLQQGIDVFLMALETLQTVMNDAPITVVYIPSPVSSYDWGESITIETYHSEQASRAGPPLQISTQKNMANSAYINAAISSGVANMGIDFIDATPALRSAGRTRLLHGPRDTKHLNAEGYRILAQVIQSAQQTRQATTLRE